MFKPYRFEKKGMSFSARPEVVPTLAGALPNPPRKIFVSKEIIKESFSAIFIFLGVGILSNQVIIPSLNIHDEIYEFADAGVILGIETEEREIIKEEDFTFSELSKDFLPEVKIERALPEIFYLSVPKLGIDKAEVSTNSGDLKPDKMIGHYKGSGIPGESGNVFLYGHSVLPWFFNPKNPMTIFSTLPDLTVGDKISVFFEAKEYIYKVESLKTVNPNEVNPLWKPEGGGKYITLMTCVPPGLKTKRLLVVAKED